jgi:hypothetical protein
MGMNLKSEGSALVSFVILLGIGLVLLGEFANSAGATSTTAQTAINDSVGKLDDFVTWIGIIVVVVGAAYAYSKYKAGGF